MRLFKHLLITAFLLLATRLPAQWHQLPGPPGGWSTDITQSTYTGFVYAATQHGVYVSKDHQKSWGKVGTQSPSFSRIQSCPVPQTEVLFAATDTELYRSMDSGASWLKVYQSTEYISDIICDSVNVWVALYDSGVVHSQTLGKNWSMLPETKYPGGVETMVRSGNYFIAIGEGIGLWRVPIAGGAWDTPSNSFLWVDALATDGEEVFVGGTNGVFVSTDHGASWIHPSNSGISGIVHMGKFAVNGLKMVANVASSRSMFASSDGARTWTRIDSAGRFPMYNDPNTLVFLDHKFIAATPSGILISPDGVTWNYADSGFISAPILDLASLGDTLFAETWRGIFTSADSGMTWLAPPFAESFGYPLSARLQNVNGRLYQSTSSALLRHNGLTWDSLVYGPARVAFQNSMLYTAAGTRGVFRSADDGASWLPGSNGLPLGINVIEDIIAHNGKLYALSVDSVKDLEIFQSDDGAQTWNSVHKFPLSGGIVSSASSTSNIFIADSGLVASTDNGLNWTYSGPSADLPIRFLKESGGDVLASYVSRNGSTPASGLWKLSDHGPVTQLLWDDSTSAITGFATDAHNAYVGTASKGIWRAARTTLPLDVLRTALGAEIGALSIFPNPLTTKTTVTVTFSLPERERVSLKLYDELGILRSIIFDGEREAGAVEIPFEDRTLSNGVYSAVLSAGMTRAVGRVVVER